MRKGASTPLGSTCEVSAPMAQRAKKDPGPARRDRGRPRGAPIERAILSHTLAELAANGREGMSIERIAAAAEVNKTSIYRRWPTKEALVDAAMEGIVVQLSTALPPPGGFADQLLDIAHQIAALLQSPGGRALFRASLDAPGSEPRRVRTVGSVARAPAKELIARARASSALRPDVPGELLLATLTGAVIHRVLVERRPATRIWLTSLIELLVQGAAPRSEPRR